MSKIIKSAEKFCEILDRLHGETWSNCYHELPKRMEQYAKYV